MKRISIYLLVTVIPFLNSCRQEKSNHFNEEASVHVTDELPENPLLLIPFSSMVQPKKSTMSTLYGNTIAANYAGTKGDGNYPQGSILYQVTWQWQPDSVWFGANIPEKILQAERIAFLKDSIQYQLFEGMPLKKTRSANAAKRIAFLKNLRMAVSP